MRGAIVALLLALSLSSCGDSAPEGYEEAVDEASSGEPDLKAMARESIKGQDPQFVGMSDEGLDRIFEVSCTGFDDGLTGEQVALAGMPTFGEGIGAVMMGAVMAYCPEHRIKVDVWMEQYS